MTYDHTEQKWKESRVGQGILLRGDTVLLCANSWYRDQNPVWTLPGGRAEPGESIEDALLREFREETGLSVRLKDFAYVVEARSTSAQRHFLTCAFTVTEVSGSLSYEGDPGVVDLRFIPIHELHLYLPSPSLGAPLQAYLSMPKKSARYWNFPEYS